MAIIMCPTSHMIGRGALQPHNDFGCGRNDFVTIQQRMRSAR
jgi:hypothetical protein